MKRGLSVLLVFAFAISFFSFSDSPRAYAADATVTVDGSVEYQTIDGFGGQWLPWTADDIPPENHVHREYLGSAVTAETGMKFFRTNIRTPADSVNTPRDYAWYVNAFQQPEFDHLWSFLQDLERHNAEPIFSRFSAPRRMLDSYKHFLETDDNYNELADFYAALCYVAIQIKGVDVGKIIFFNEPDGDWDTYMTPAQYVRTVKTAGQKLDSVGLSGIKIIGPGTYNSVNLNTYVDALTSDAVAMSYMAAFDTHGWDNRTANPPFDPHQMIPYLETAAQTASSKGYGHIPFYVTEMGTSVYGGENVWVEPGVAGNTDSYDYGFYTALATHEWLTANAPLQSMFIWDSYSYISGGALMGKTSNFGSRKSPTENYEARPFYNTMYNFYKYIKPGSIRISASSNHNDIIGSAYKNDGKSTVVLLNKNGSADRTVTVQLSNLTSSGMTVISTSKNALNKDLGDQPVVNGQITVKVPAQGIVTLTDMGQVTVRKVGDSTYKDYYWVTPGQSIQLAANVAGAADSVTWSVYGGSANGTVSPTGLYTAPPYDVSDIVAVKAISTADPTSVGYAYIKANSVNILSRGKPYFVDSYLDAPNSDPSHALDGNSSTKWNSKPGSEHWMQVDLGGYYDLTGYRVKHAGAGKEGWPNKDTQTSDYNTRDWHIKTSSDGVNWNYAEYVWNNTGNISNRTIQGMAGTENVRYVSMYITKSTSVSGDDMARIYEFEVYGKPADKISLVDEMVDFSKVYSHTNGWEFDSTHSEFMEGDTSRVGRIGDDSLNIVYKLNNIYDFSVRINSFGSDLAGKVKFYASPDNRAYSEVAAAHDAPVGTGGGWYRTYFKPSAAIPSGTQYLKIELRNDPLIFTPQIGRVQLFGDLPDAGGRIVDELTNFAKVHSYSAADLAIALNPSENIGGEIGRVYRNKQIAANLVYEVPADLDSFDVDTYALGGETVEDFKFYTTPNGSTYTLYNSSLVEKIVQPGNWDRVLYRATALPAGTRYLKIEFGASSTNAWNPQIGRVTLDYGGGPAPLADFADYSRLERVMAKARSGQNITIGFIGGSITQGFNSSNWDSTSWTAKVKQWWESKYPGKITYVNAGIGGTPSVLGAHRAYMNLLQSNPDFVVVEFAVNDGADSLYTRAYEGLIRQILKSPNQPAVMSLYIGDQAGANRQEAHIPVADYYRLPQVHYKDRIQNLVANGTNTWLDFYGTTYVPQYKSGSYPAGDGTHPNDTAQARAGLYIIEKLENVYNTLKPDVQIPGVPVIPSVMTDDTYEFAALYHRGNLTPSSETVGSWTQGSHNIGTGYGWQSSTVGNELVFDVSGSTIAFGFYTRNGPDAGMVEAWVDDGPRTVFDSYTPEPWETIKYAVVQSGLTKGPHKLHIKIKPETNPNSSGHLFEVVNVLPAGME